MGNFFGCPQIYHLMDTESSSSSFQLLIGSSNHLHDHQRFEDPGGGLEATITTTTEDLPTRTNQDSIFIDNNCNDGRMDRVFILTEIHSNCQEDSDIHLQESSLDNNCNTTECHERMDYPIDEIPTHLDIILEPP